jgi:heme/copper-type cytochrome/quinol oxidase subunit 2
VLLLSLLLSKDRQIQAGAEWDTVVGFSVVILIVAVVAVLVALAVSRSRDGRRRRRIARRRHRGGAAE